MHKKRFSRNSLNRLLGHEAVADEVSSSHAYGRVARGKISLPRKVRIAPREGQSIPGYRDSMVGSITQYRSNVPIPTRKPEDVVEENVSQDEKIIGNRPKSGTKRAPKKDAESVRRRHHFIEPPKRSFNKFS